MLNQQQVETLNSAARAALEECVSTLRETRDEVNREESRGRLSTVCEVLAQLSSRCDATTIELVAKRFAALYSESSLAGDWRLQQAVSDVCTHVGDYLGRSEAGRVLEIALDLRVPGEAGGPARPNVAGQWQDITDVAGEFTWTSREAASRAIQSRLNDVLDRLTTSDGAGREYLCLRLVNFLQPGLMTQSQRRRFRDALFLHCDE